MNLESRACTLCGPQASKRVKYAANFAASDLNAEVFSARRSPDRKHFQLVTCASCGIIYSDPACDPSQLRQLYAQSDVTYSEQEEQIYQCYAPILDRALQRTSLRQSFVEVGGGRGFMLRYGSERGFASQTEVEPSRDAAAKFTPLSPKQQFVCDVFAKDTLPAGSASLICFFQVLDHIPNPKKFLDDAWTALAPGGVVVCITHNTDALSAKLLGRRSPIFDIEHTYLFNLRNIAKLLEQSGYTDVESFPITNAYSARYWLNLLPGPQPLRQGAIRLLDKSPLRNVKLRLRAGNLAAIATKPLVH